MATQGAVVATSQPLLPPAIAPGVLEAVSDALCANRWLHIDYQNAAGKPARQRSCPWAWPNKARACIWCVCRYEGFDNERSLAPPHHPGRGIHAGFRAPCGI